MSVLWCATTNGVREIVKERIIFKHEIRVGLNEVAYYFSKILVLGFLAVMQALLLLIILGALTGFAGSWITHGLILSLLALTGTAIGLLLSILAPTSERAMALLPVILMGEAIFSGGLARLTGVPKWIAMICASSYWSLSGLKGALPTRMIEATYVSAPGEYQPPILGETESLLLSSLALPVHLMALVYLSLFLLRRFAGDRINN
jgi:hypothetical protein